MTTTNPTVLVVGAAGRIAGLVVPELARRSAVVRGLVRSEDQAATAQKNGAVEVVHGDLRDPDSLDEAVRGVDAVFHIGPAFVADEAQLGLEVVAAAQRGGVGKVVFSGVAHPSDRLENHVSKRPVEDALFRSGLTFAVLQPVTLYQNIGLVWPGVLERGELAEPYSNTARIARVDYRDVAEVAAIALTEDRLDYGTFELCSGEMLDRHEVVAVISEILGRPVRATALNFDSWAAVAGSRFDAQQLALFAEVFRSYDEHEHGGNGLVLETILGRRPRTLRDYVRDLAAGERTHGGAHSA
ncbi:NmrA family NAD(P)-binding protein [Pseudonocardia sp. DSM 110487]|uniref:NmrA family NAD(P)-binding protein n=1 Tax=Pseudonocardia sp. DSM 110487 TaxID=2865833 RepID=UPI001C698590|nr:NmrA family NAD(P)-binding protein [Pseudonocardia sp. DSM 110487]QYN32555.1 NmrA family NAD(P)-binding protein [Pseudonocardia sp. DSM 110487]